jgi:hypothetical protein
VNISLHAQDAFFNDSLRRDLKNYLVDKNVALDRENYSIGNLNIFNEINNKNIDLYDQDKDYKYGIYSFRGINTPAFSEILIRRGDEYEILGMLNEGDLMDIMIKLIAYFYRYPDIPKELFPLYVDVVSRIYNLNHHWEGAFNVKKKRDISEY